MCHVLVIEDEAMIATFIEELAADAGATSVDIPDTEAAAVASTRLRPPAVILSDVNLTEGTGPMACAAILEELGHRPVIFITGTPEACQPCDYAAAVLGKPVIPHELVDIFRQVAPL